MEQVSGAYAHVDEMTWVAPLLRGVFEVHDVTVGALDGMATRLRGRFLTSTERAYRMLAPEFAARGRTLMFRREEDRDVILSVYWVNRPKPNNRWLPVLLAVLTVVSVLVTYLLMYSMTEFSWEGAQAGLGEAAQFAVALVGILLAHEMGHYVVARRQGLAVTPPYLIPFPLSPFGTMGAVIRMKDIPVNKRAMLLTGAAGPISGLIVALPVVIVGLILSEARPLPEVGSYIIEGNSLLYLLLKYLIHGEWLPTATHDVFMHPLAFAGWAGLLVTAFNLIPAGQLDGGHIAYALLGTKSRYLTWGIILALAALGVVWPGWWLWAALVFFFSRTQQEPLDTITPLGRGEIAIAIGLLIMLVLTFTPLPLRIVN
jgi:membrane-associated protease RseP (regulator of RpoE activity)